MTHWEYVTIAYGGFALLLCWDYIAPKMRLKNSARAIALQLRRKKPL